MRTTALAVRLAARDLRGGLRGFRLFVACLALGVAAIAGVGAFSDAVVAGLQANARELLGGDVDIRLHNRKMDPDALAYVERRTEEISVALDMRAMASPAKKNNGGRERSLVELKAVDGAYPLLGALTLDPPMAPKDAFAKKDGAFGAAVDPNLLDRLGIKIGDSVRVGDATFQVRAAIVKEPDRIASVVNFGPRLMIADDAVTETGLVQPGSRIHYHYRVRLPANADDARWIEALNETFPKAGWRVLASDESAPGVQRFIGRMTLFLTFAGLTVLLIGGIGVGNAVKSHLDGRIATIATFKCLGAPAGLVFAIYLLQIAAVAAVGIVAGILGGLAVAWGALAAVGPLLPIAPVPGFYAGPVAMAALFGALIALTFALWPLARARDIPGAVLFRVPIAPMDRRPRASAVVAVGIGIAALAALTVWTASEKGFALWFVAGTAATLAALRLGASAIRRLAKSMSDKGPRHAGWRMALGNLHRPGTPAPTVILSLGAGLTVLVAVALIQGNMGRNIAERLPEEAPAFFFIDIQPDQAEAFDKTVLSVPGTRDLERVPSLRGLITRIDGRPVEQVDIHPSVQWAVRGDRALTYATKRPPDARIVAGKWWPEDYKGPPLLSLDATVAKGFGIGVGDTLTVNVLGREIEGRIASLREIDWKSLRFDFALVFSPGALEGAPFTHIAAVRAPKSAESAVENAVADRFANVAAIRVREALDAAARILAGVGAAVRAAAAATILAGALVLAGAIAATRQRRVYDAVVFKVLGATRKRLLGTFVLEFGVLGLATGLVAAAVGTLAAWAVVVFLMDMPWRFLPEAVLTTVAAALSVTLAAGFAGAWTALGTKAAPYLRND